MKSIRAARDIGGKRVLVRVDWNVPLEEGVVRDDYRIKKSLPTIELLQKADAKVILATHLEPTERTVEPLRRFVPAGVDLLENLRGNAGEEANSVGFAKELASQADLFVNEAFSVSHRKHASIVGVPQLLPSFAGLEFMTEVEELSKAFHPSHPFLLILGGAKFETKLPLVEKFLDLADRIFIGGAMAKRAAALSIASHSKVVLPVGDISALDADEANLDLLKSLVADAKFIVWNGPLGAYERGHTQGTASLARLVAESGAVSIVGGADTLAAIKDLNIFDKFSFVSAGGGAMLDFLANGTLPGIEALG